MLIKHLGGIGKMVCVEWLHRAHVYGLPCVSHLVDGHLGTKRFDISNVEKLQVQPHGIMGSAWII